MARLSLLLIWLMPVAAGADATTDEQAFLEKLLENSFSARYSITTVFDTHPPDVQDNTGNVFNWVPYGQLIVRHSAVAFRLSLDDPDNPGGTTALLAVRFLPSGLLAETESGEPQGIIYRVVDRNLLEPILKKVFRGKIGKAVANTLDEAVVDRLSDRIASEILSRVPVTASVRQFMVEIGHAMGDNENVKARAGILLPSIGAPRDESNRTKLDEKLITGPDLEYTMLCPGRTLAAELSYVIRLNGKKVFQITGGLNQAQDTDATVGQTIRNAVFDEGATELSPLKVDFPYLQAVFSGERFETFGSVAYSEGLWLTAGQYFRFTEKTAVALEAAYRERDNGQLTRLEELAETSYRHGAAVTLIHDFNDVVTGYLMAENAQGVVGRKREFSTDRLKAGLVFTLHRAVKVGFSTYRRDRGGDPDTGFETMLQVNF